MSHPFVPLCLLLAAPAPAPLQGPSFEVPIVVRERAGVAQNATPLTTGIPFATGELVDPVPLEVVDAAGRTFAADGRPLSRWPDGSVRWLAVEFVGPGLEPNESFSGTLRPRSHATLGGTLSVSGGFAGVPLRVDNGVFQVEAGSAPGDLFRIHGAGSGDLAAPIRSELQTLAGDFKPSVLVPGPVEVEHETELAITLVRRDEWRSAVDRPVIRLTTRLTVFRDSPAARLQHSIDVLAGLHRMHHWSLRFPFADPGVETRLAMSLEDEVERSVNFTVRQIDASTYRMDGTPYHGRFPGAVAVDGCAIVPEHFWQLHPSGIRRQGDDVVVEIGPCREQDRLTLEEGFGRTRTLWLWFGDAADERTTFELASAVDRPQVARSTPEWYADSGALPSLTLPDGISTNALERRFEESADRVFSRRESNPRHHYGLMHFGDFYDGEHGFAYSGPLNQEYDPGSVFTLQFLRTGNEKHFDRARELAWHYADVDVSWYGGSYQHRATSHHVDSWIAGIFAGHFRRLVHAHARYDGTLESIYSIARWDYGRRTEEELRESLAPVTEWGATGEELENRLFLIIGQNEVDRLSREVPSHTESNLRDYAQWIAAQPDAQEYGFDDVDRDFRGFFELYGGSWNDFPAFHTDIHPFAQERHQGGHSLIEGVVYAHYLSGEPRFRDVARTFGRHQVDQVLPHALHTLVRSRNKGEADLRGRRVGWPLINLVAIAEMTQGMPGEEILHVDAANAADTAASEIRNTPFGSLQSSIHAGVCLEGLAKYHRLTDDPATRAALRDFGRQWANDCYDWAQHAFVYQPRGSRNPSRGMSGLVLFGLGYSHALDPDPQLAATILDAWEHLPTRTSNAKSFAMVYRGLSGSTDFVRAIQGAAQP